MQFIVQPHSVLVVMLVVIAAFAPSVPAESFAGHIIYSGTKCSGTPLVMSIIDADDCEDVECLSFSVDDTTYSSATTCENTSRQTYVADVFANFSYVMVETFTNKCEGFLGATVYLATGECQIYNDQGSNYVIAKVNEDGSASLGIYNTSSCSGAPFLGYEPDSEAVENHSCYKNYTVIYTSAENNSEGGDSDISAPMEINSPQKVDTNTGSNGSADDSDRNIVGSDEGSTTVTDTAPEKSGGINTGAIIGIIVAYVILCTAAGILCMDRMQRCVRRLGLRR
ncbi:TKL protein kinase [Phytophthora megakarya]|uniref:TKL protein kinase n=1 Tax=Phytophthora megakarya TaxID=4795 RepID=A0A225W062_9STRA|nr:TKL protein kinase [Phytophthora megakarya]